MILNCGSAFLHLKDAYDKGLVSDEAITAAVERLMEVRIRLGMMRIIHRSMRTYRMRL